MLKLIQIVGISGFFITLSIMYLTDLGVRGIRKIDPSFQSPDMKLHYSASQIAETFEKMDAPGRALYQKYLILDCAFAIFLLIVMLMITCLLLNESKLRFVLFAVCIFRGVFDILENILLLRALGMYPKMNGQLAFCSLATTFKFMMLGLWVLLIIFLYFRK